MNADSILVGGAARADSAVPRAVTVAYLAFGKTKHAVVCKSAIGNQQLAIRRDLTATGAERVANRVNAVVRAIQRLS